MIPRHMFVTKSLKDSEEHSGATNVITQNGGRANKSRSIKM